MDWLPALSDGWLKSVMVGLLALVGGWFMRRPLERAAIVAETDKSIGRQIARLEREISRLQERCEASEERCQRSEARAINTERRHDACEANLAEVRREIAEILDRCEPAAGPLVVNPRPPGAAPARD